MRRAGIEPLLPAVFQRTLVARSPLVALLDVMEVLHAPCEQAIEGFGDVLDARATESRFLTMLAHWVDLGRIFPTREAGELADEWRPRTAPIPPDRLRELICSAADLAQWRGTARGLKRFLEIATGASPFELREEVEDADRSIIPFHLKVVAPAVARPLQDLIERIVAQEKPAYVTWELAWTE